MPGWTQIGTGIAWVYASAESGLIVADDYQLSRDGQSMQWNPSTRSWTRIGGHFSDILPASQGIYATSYDDQYRVSEWHGATWTDIGGPFQRITGGGQLSRTPDGRYWSRIYAVSGNTGNICQYDGAPGMWTEIGSPTAMLVEVSVPGTSILYSLSPDNADILEYTGTPGVWHRIGGPAHAIFGGPYGWLWAVESSGNIRTYDRRADRWYDLALAADDPIPFVPNAFFCSSMDNIYYLPPDRSAVYGYRQPVVTPRFFNGHRWSRLGGPFRTITASPQGLLGLDPARNLSLYEWPEITFAPDPAPNGMAGYHYSFQLSLVSGNAPFTFLIEGGNLPTSLTMTTSGYISGVPIFANNWSFVVLAFDAEGASARRTFNIIIQPAGGSHPPPTPPVPTDTSPDVRFLYLGAPIVVNPAIFHADEAFTVSWSSVNYGYDPAPAHNDQLRIENLDTGAMPHDQTYPVDELMRGRTDMQDISIEGLEAGRYRAYVSLNVDHRDVEHEGALNNDTFVEFEIYQL